MVERKRVSTTPLKLSPSQPLSSSFLQMLAKRKQTPVGGAQQPRTPAAVEEKKEEPPATPAQQATPPATPPATPIAQLRTLTNKPGTTPAETPDTPAPGPTGTTGGGKSLVKNPTPTRQKVEAAANSPFQFPSR